MGETFLVASAPYELTNKSGMVVFGAIVKKPHVLLIHGLTGDPIKTWGGRLEADNAVSDCWPRRLAVELQSKATLWTLGYPAPAFNRQLSTISSTIYEEGRKALSELVAPKVGLGKKPIIFVSHSLGGLLAKAILAQSAKHDSHTGEREILENTHAVIFAGTPHAGSIHAKWRFLVPFVVRMATKGVGVLLAAALAAIWIAGVPFLSVHLFGWTWQVTLTGLSVALVSLVVGAGLASWSAPGRHVLMLDPDNPGLRDLKQDFRRVRSKRTFFIDSFFEEKRLWGLFLVVPWWSADPGVTDCEPDGIPADHISMCKNPHAALLQRRVEERVKTAGYGKEISVFGEKLKRLFKDEFNVAAAYEVLFESRGGDRGEKEDIFRTFLRGEMSREAFVPSSTELDLAQRSRFDQDTWVWTLWREKMLASGLRHLRKKAKEEVDKNYRSAPDSSPTLIPFYRSLRTIEHICAGNLWEPGAATVSDREVLRNLIEKARMKLEELCKVHPSEVDTDGATRRLLLRMWCMLQAVQAAQDYVAGVKGRHGGGELSVFLAKSRTDFDNALRNFRNELKLLP